MKKMWLASGIMGAWTAIAFVSSIRVFSIDGTLSLVEFLIAIVSPSFGAVLISKKLGVSMSILFVVAYLTLAVPILGPSFGGTGKENILLFALMGLIAGLVWSTPFCIYVALVKYLGFKKENP